MRPMKIGLEIDGGGAKGFIPLMSLVALEKRTGVRAWEAIDLAIGVSVGAILAAIVASGKLSAADALTWMRTAVPKIFTRQGVMPMYSRKPFREVWDSVMGNLRLGDARVPLIIGAVNECDGEPYFFTSDNPADADLPLRQVVEYSFAAPLFFGGIDDPQHRARWLDGGTGIDNCALLQCMRSMVQRRWFSDDGQCHIVSLGCGHHHRRIAYDIVNRWLGRNLREIQLYLSREDGGLARRQSIGDRVRFASDLDPALPNFSFDRLDCELTAAQDKMDAVKFIDEYQRIGEAVATKMDIQPFSQRLGQRVQHVVAQARALRRVTGGVA